MYLAALTESIGLGHLIAAFSRVGRHVDSFGQSLEVFVP